MADLILPSPLDLEKYREPPDDATAIQRAADLFTMATGIDKQEELDGPLEVRIWQQAVLEMAWAITERHEDAEASFSPFNSERIGSYSYSKAQKAVSEGEKTGVSAFDEAVAYFLSKAINGDYGHAVASEWVFKPGYNGRHEDHIGHDPSYGWWSH